MRCMQGRVFDVERAEDSLGRVLGVSVGRSSRLRPGPSLTDAMLERQRDHTQNVQAFVGALKVGLSRTYVHEVVADEACSTHTCLTSTPIR